MTAQEISIPIDDRFGPKIRRNGRQFRRFLWILSVGFGMIYPSYRTGAAEQVSYDSHGKRDPFMPLVTLTSRVASGLVGIENSDDIMVEGIVFDPKKGSVVIINGSVLKEGEEFGNLKVLKIRPDGAIFSVNGTECYKPLYQQETKKE